MARATKRLRRKTTVSQKGCSELMMLTSEWWMQFVFAVGRYTPALNAAVRNRVWRLLCKAWREVWDQGFRVKLSLPEGHVYELSLAVRCSDDLVFSRDSCNKIRFVLAGRVHESCRYCLVSMPWNTFKELRPILFRMVKNDCPICPHKGRRFRVHSFAQTAFFFQSEL